MMAVVLPRATVITIMIALPFVEMGFGNRTRHVMILPANPAPRSAMTMMTAPKISSPAQPVTATLPVPISLSPLLRTMMVAVRPVPMRVMTTIVLPYAAMG